jgi:hypothetical protein
LYLWNSGNDATISKYSDNTHNGQWQIHRLKTNYKVLRPNITLFLNLASAEEATTTANPVALSMAGLVSDTQGTSRSTDSPASNTGNNFSPPVDTTNNLKPSYTKSNSNGSNAATQDYSSSSTQISSTLEFSTTSNTSSGNVTAKGFLAITNIKTVTSTKVRRQQQQQQQKQQLLCTPPVNTCTCFD